MSLTAQSETFAMGDISLKGVSHEDWLKLRQIGIGGSDAAKVFGISKWGGPLSVWMDKTGRSIESEMSEAAEMGIELEETVARIFCKRTNLKVEKRNKIFVHPSYPWMIANIDRKIVGENKGLECKTTHYRNGGLWDGDDLPDDYYAQVQHYIEVMGWDSCYIAALIGGQKLVYKEVKRDSDFIRVMIEKEREFWESYVFTDTMPPANEYDDVGELYQESTVTDLIEPIDSDLAIANELYDVKQKIKALELKEALLSNTLKQRIGDASGIFGVVTWKSNKPSTETDWEAVAKVVNAPQSVINKYTKTKPGNRPLTLKIKKEEGV